jgi:ubiquinone/menaquinone biosynthesis C-methylase UbiE
VKICCFLCALLSGILALVLSHGWTLPEAYSQDLKVQKSTPKKTTKRYTFRDDHDPNGIGKFYMGREIALVMTYHGADWLERTEREQEEHLQSLVELLKVKQGSSVADIGAGSGVITLMLAREVGDKGKVFAVDIQPEMLEMLGDKLKNRSINNVERVLSNEKNPKLKPKTVDLAIMVDVYHEFEFPYEMMLELSKSLKPNGRIAFVEYRLEDPEVPIKLIHKMSEAQVKKEVEQPEFGLKWKETISSLPRQHVIVFEKTDKEPPQAEN